MPLRHFPVILVPLAWLAVDAAAVSHFHRQATARPGWLATLTVGVVLGQLALLSLWLIASGTGSARKAMLLAAALAAGSLTTALATDGAASGGKWLALLSGFVLVLLASLALWGVAQGDPPGRSRGPVAAGRATRHGQLTLARLFSWTTSIAVLLGLAQWIDRPGKPLLGLAAFCLLLALASLVLIAVSPPRASWLVFAGCLCLLVPLLVLLLPWTGIPPQNPWWLAVLALAHAATISGTLAVVRVLRCGPQRSVAPAG